MLKIRYLLLGLVFLFINVHAVSFKEITEELNIEFKHNDGRNGSYQFTETAGSGIAWLDYNNDNLVDLLLINGFKNKHKLYKNLGSEFVDVTSMVLPNINDLGMNRGMGVCSADVNQDGWVDFLITSYGVDILYLNNKGKNYQSKLLDANKTKKWSTSCAFADLDNDGDIDLYVTRYVVFTLNGNKTCQQKNARGYCNPKAYNGETDGLYMNDGTGNFSDEAHLRGIIPGAQDRGFAVIISDFDQDNDMDIYVANDGSNNRLYINNGKGFLKDNGLMSGTAINQDGITEASMGLALGDFNHDGLQDLVVSHFSMETNTLYQNYGKGFFVDNTQSYGINKTSYMSMGWGVALIDSNNNGLEDMLVANGHIHDFIKNIDNRQTYKQENQLFLNQDSKRFVLQPQNESFTTVNSKSSRGLAIADWNNDGKVDFAINNIFDSAEVFKNIDKNKNTWLGIKLVGNKSNSSAIGAVAIVKDEKSEQRKEVISGGSFMSQSDFRLVFGLGKNTKSVELLISWPDGKKSKHSIEKLNQYHTIHY